MIALLAAGGIGVALALCMLRLFAGPTLYDRMLAANAVIAKAGLISAALAVFARQTLWLDAALALMLGAFVANVAVLKFFRARTFQAPLVQTREEA